MAEQKVKDLLALLASDSSDRPQRQLFYVEDTVALVSDPNAIGMIDRTHSDIASHRPIPGEVYEQPVGKSDAMSELALGSLLRSGVPPRGTILVSFAVTSTGKSLNPRLLWESEVTIVDRWLLFGDVVRRKPGDAMSGIIVENVTKVSLMQSLRWPDKMPAVTPQLEYTNLGNFDMNIKHFLHDIPSHELVGSVVAQEGLFVLHKGWVGRIQQATEEWLLRLENNSVVAIKEEDADDTMAEYLGEEGVTGVGQLLRCKKGTLRRGRWIFGDFDPNIDPAGYVCGINVTSVGVEWFETISGVAAEPPPPPELEAHELFDGDYRLYDRAEILAPEGSKKLTPELFVGNIVRFKNLADAANKYDGSSGKPKINRLPRSETLGYDMNVFLVVQSRTECIVQWQDSSISTHNATELHPAIDLDDDDAVWPGELITTREHDTDVDGLFVPKRAGIVQSVDPVDRIAHVKWFPDATLAFITEEWDLLSKASTTGIASGPTEEMSLYDIWAPPALARRLGDYLMIDPRALLPDHTTEVKTDVESYEWFGELIELGLDGLLTIRVGAANEAKDIRVPWESTIVAHSADDEEHDHSLASTASEVDSLIESDGESGDLAEWRDMDNEVIDEEDTEWTTDEDPLADLDDDGKRDYDIEMSDAPRGEEQPVINNGEAHDSLADDSGVPCPQPTIKKFSYSSMFNNTTTPPTTTEASSPSPISKPESFVVLDGQAPSEHRFAGRNAELSPQSLRRIQKEHKILRTSLPDGVYVRTWESSLNLMRILILGPMDTPYEYAPFIVDLLLEPNFPSEPPRVSFHSWTDNSGPINPNLYEDGTVCLSLLGTWPGETRNEFWSPNKSTILQLIVSLLGLVLVKEPYYNEAGYEERAGTVEAELPSALYSERVYFRSRRFINHVLNNTILGFESEVYDTYLRRDPQSPYLFFRAILSAILVIHRSRKAAVKRDSGKDVKISAAAADEHDRTISPGALISLRREICSMIDVLQPNDQNAATELRRLLGDPAARVDRESLRDNPAIRIVDELMQ